MDEWAIVVCLQIFTLVLVRTFYVVHCRAQCVSAKAMRSHKKDCNRVFIVTEFGTIASPYFAIIFNHYIHILDVNIPAKFENCLKTTAGTNRVCSRCLALKDTVVGYTDELGVTLPPLHPRCRCAIMYDEVGTPRAMQPKPKSTAQPEPSKTPHNAEENLQRPTTNRGAFAHLEVPMQLRAVKQICRKYGVDISELRIKIQRGEDLLRADFAGMTAYEDIGRIDLTPHAFLNEEQLVRTIIHEGCHVKQLKKYGREYVQMNILHMEKTAKRYEDFFTRLVKRRASNVPTSKVDRYFL